MLERLASTPKECLQFADTFFDFEDHKLLLGSSTHWPGGRWLRRRLVNGGVPYWQLRSFKELTSVPIQYTDVEGEQAILAELFPDRTTRPKKLLDSGLTPFARYRSVRYTFAFEEDKTKLYLECAQIGPKRYMMLGTLLACSLEGLSHFKARLAATNALTLPAQAKVLVQLQQLKPDLYQKLSQGNAVPSSSVLLGLVPSAELPSGIHMDIPSEVECVARMEAEYEAEAEAEAQDAERRGGRTRRT